jgi:hypothetical protein
MESESETLESFEVIRILDIEAIFREGDDRIMAIEERRYFPGKECLAMDLQIDLKRRLEYLFDREIVIVDHLIERECIEFFDILGEYIS